MFTTLISTADLAAHLADPAFVLVDVRHDLTQPDAWGEAAYGLGHLPGARFVHLDRDLSAPKTGRNGRHPLPNAQTCAELFGRLGIDATKQVVAYDQGSGMYAARLWWMLRALGHDAAAVLDGGYAAWTNEGRPVATALPAHARATFSRSAVRFIFTTAQAGWRTTRPWRRRIVRFGRSVRAANSTPSRTVNSSNRFRFSSLSESRHVRRPLVHGLVSTTIGRRPPSDHLQKLSMVRLAINRCART